MMPEKCDLYVYSAGAVSPSLRDAIGVFENKFGVHCNLKVGKPGDLLAEIAESKRGDVSKVL
jgi:hypothetical protein